MKYFILLIPIICFSQKIYSVDYSSKADIKVYVVDYESQCDLKVYKLSNHIEIHNQQRKL